MKPQTHFAKCLEKAENFQTPTYDLSNSNNITKPHGASVCAKSQIFDVPAKIGIPNAFCEMFRKNRKFFKPQHKAYQNSPNNITKPFGASVWPKSQIFDVPAKIGIPNAFCEMFRKNRKFFKPQHMTYQNSSNKITKPSGASVWPKSQFLNAPAPAKIGVLDPF